MSVVTSEIFEHTKQEIGSDYETDRDFKYNTCRSLKTYGLDDKFHVEGSYYSGMMGKVSTSITLSVAEVKRLRKQLDEFISQNS